MNTLRQNELAWIGIAVAMSVAGISLGGWRTFYGLAVGFLFSAGYVAVRRGNAVRYAPTVFILTKSDLRGRDYVLDTFTTDQEA